MFVVEMKFPEMDAPIYLARLANGEYGYALKIEGAERFDDAEVAMRVMTSWAPRLAEHAHAVEVDE